MPVFAPLLLLLTIAVPPVPEVERFTGKVVAVHDGDTITVLDGKTQLKVRLNGIDAPEAKQAFGTKSKDALAEKIFGQTVEVRSAGADRFGRTLGIIKLGPRNINREMVEGGWAWEFRKYVDSSTLDKAEAAAKAAKLGLWADAHPVAPWDWRAKEKAKRAAAKATAPPVKKKAKAKVKKKKKKAS